MRKSLLLFLALTSTCFGIETLTINPDGTLMNTAVVKFAPGHLQVGTTDVTAAGNTFNGPNELLKLTSLGKLPVLDGSALTGLTKTQVGLPNADNTSDLNKPISTAVQSALDLKQNALPMGNSAQYIRGDQVLASFNKITIGLPNVDNTSDLSKPISTDTQTALNAKQSTSAKGTPNGYAALGVDGKVPSGQLPAPSVGGTVSSVGLSLPGDFVIGGTNPITGTGTFAVTWATQASNSWFGTLAGGTPGFKTAPFATVMIPTLDAIKIGSGVLASARIPVMVGVGATHAPGAVGDPGTTGNATDYWGRDAIWHNIPVIVNTTGPLVGNNAGGANAGKPQDFDFPASSMAGLTVVDWSKSHSFGSPRVLTANTTFTFTNTKDGQTIILAVQNTASNFTVTWPNTVKWPGHIQPPQTLGVNTDVWTFTQIGTVIYGAVSQNY